MSTDTQTTNTQTPETTENKPKPKKSVALSGVAAGNTALCTVGRTATMENTK